MGALPCPATLLGLSGCLEAASVGTHLVLEPTKSQALGPVCSESGIASSWLPSLRCCSGRWLELQSPAFCVTLGTGYTQAFVSSLQGGNGNA